MPNAVEVAKRCGVTPRTVMRWRKEKDFPPTETSHPFWGGPEEKYDWEQTKEWLSSRDFGIKFTSVDSPAVAYRCM